MTPERKLLIELYQAANKLMALSVDEVEINAQTPQVMDLMDVCWTIDNGNHLSSNELVAALNRLEGE